MTQSYALCAAQLTVLLYGRPDSRLKKFLDHGDDLIVVLVIRERVLLLGSLTFNRLTLCDIDQGLAGRDCLCDEAKHLGLDVAPVGVAALGDCDVIRAVEDGADAVDVHELRG